MSNATNFIKQHAGTIGIGVGATILGGTVGYLASRRRSKSKSRKRRKLQRKVRRKTYHYIRKKGRRYTPHTAGKRKDTSHRRIRYTKNGQPYVIMASGKARFISLRSAKSSHKRRGGRY